MRAAVPIALIIEPPAPMRIPFCDSASTQTRARTRTRPPRTFSMSSTTTSTACGTSWKVRRSTCSRTSSASSTSSDWSEWSEAGNRNGPAGSRPLRCSTSSTTPLPVRAEIGKTSLLTPRSAAAWRAAMVRGRSSRSTLLTAITTGTGDARSEVAMKRSPGPTPSRALRTISAASESASSRSTRRCIRWVSASRGRWTPGRSTRTSCEPAVVATPRIARRVVCGLSETIATFWPTIALTRVDLPTLGRPASATNPDRVATSGSPLTRTAARAAR